MSLRFRIVLLVLMATLTPAAILGLYLVRIRGIEITKAEKSLKALAGYAAADLEGKVNGTVQLLHGLSKAPTLGSVSKAACSAFLAEVLGRYPQYTGLLTVRPDGQLHCDSLQSGRTLDLNDRAYFRQARASAEPAFDAVFGRLTGIAVLQIAYPAQSDDGELQHVLLASLNLAQFSARFATASPHPGMEMLIWDRRGTVLVRYPDAGEKKFSGSSLASSDLYGFVKSEQDDDVTEVAGPDGTVKIWARSILPTAAGGGLRISLGVPREVLLAEANEDLRQVLSILAGATLLVCLAALLFAEMGIGSPVARITKAAARQGTGDPGARIGTPYPRGELGGLMATLDATAASVQAQQGEIGRKSEQLRRSNRTLRTLSAINSTIVRVHDRKELLAEACRIAAVEGGFPIAWAGLVERGTTRVKPIAWQGVDEAYAISAMRRADDRESLVGTVIREKRALILDDSMTEPRLVQRDTALRLGSRSFVLLPLLVAGEVSGIFVLHAREIGFFDAQEMKLLQELAGDIGFALEYIEKTEKLDYLAFHDPLTGLANRALLHERLGQFLAIPGREGRKFAVVAVDIERFRTINETFGRHAGDDLLKQFAARATRHMSDPRWLARTGSDQFASIIPDVENAGAVQLIERRLVEVLGAPFVLGGAEVTIAIKIGVAMFPDDGVDADTLLRNAEAALKKAKVSGERYVFYTQEMTARVARDLALENQLRQALEKDELVLHYQPRISLDTRRIVGVEARLRWQSPDQGLLSSEAFDHLLERTGLMLPVGEWTLKQAVRDHHEWRDAGLNAPRIAINVSPLQLRRRNFVSVLKQALGTAAPPPALDLEIAESLAVEDVGDTVQKLTEIRALGIRIAIDAFGTGASSLASLSRLPVQALKIDRSLIAAMLNNPHAMTLVSTIISLAHGLRMHVVAEGVESEEEAKILRLLRCDELQGDLFSPAVTKEELLRLLRQEA